MARVPGDFEIAEGDPCERYILLHTSHDGSSNVEAMFVTIRVVCNNTLQAAVRGAKSKVRIRHTASAGEALQEAHRVLCESETYWQRLRETFARMNEETFGDRAEVMSFVEAMFPAKADDEGKIPTRTQNMRDRVLSLFDGGADGSDRVRKGSKWAMFQAVTQFIDRDRAVNKTTNRWESSTFGTGADARQRAMNLLVGAAE